MKNNLLWVVFVLLSSFYGFSQRGVRIGYVDMDYILENVEEYSEATVQLEAKVQRWKQDIELKQRTVEQMKKDLNAEKVLLTDALITEREEEIQILEKELVEYQHNRFGPQGDLVIQKQQLIQPIQDQVFNEVQKIGKDKRYDFIFDKSADVVMLYSEKRHDLSDLILRQIARTRRVKEFNTKEQKRRAKQLAGEEPEISEALRERQAKAAETREVKAEAMEARRAEKLQLREERKKAYEARIQQLWDERDARRKAKLEARKKAKEQQKDSISQ